ncbi:unnamed protein product, partial [Phaeothamnion confervicola]
MRKKREQLPYVEEVGHGTTFSQDDLSDDLSCILDAGDALLFVWHGAEADRQTSMLASAVARAYLDNL